MKYSILIVNYNKENEIERCINSVLNQTYDNYELIIVDDGSTDNSRKIINKYKKNKKVRIFFKENTGVSDTRNFAITKVKTKYFMFVDSDDYIDNNLLEEIEKYKEYDILSFNCYMVRKNKVKKDKSKGLFNSNDGEVTMNNYISSRSLFLVPWGYMYNIDLFKKNKLKYPTGFVHEDVYLTTILILMSKNTITIPYYGYYYVQTGDSIIRSTDYEKQTYRIDCAFYIYYISRKYIIENVKNKNNLSRFLNYNANVVLYEGFKQKGKAQKYYMKKLKETNLIDDLEDYTILKKIKKTALIINPKLYFKFQFLSPVLKKIYFDIKRINKFIKRDET